MLKEALNDNQQIISTLKAVLEKIGEKDTLDPVENYFNTELIDFGRDFRLGEKIRNSLEGQRFYYDLFRERYWNNLCDLEAISESADFSKIQQAYESGRFGEAAIMLKDVFLNGAVPEP